MGLGVLGLLCEANVKISTPKCSKFYVVARWHELIYAKH